jgi:hypothetical protein
LGALAETVLHAFTGADGFDPAGSLLADPHDMLFGVTIFGSTGGGVVFELRQ